MSEFPGIDLGRKFLKSNELKTIIKDQLINIDNEDEATDFYYTLQDDMEFTIKKIIKEKFPNFEE